MSAVSPADAGLPISVAMATYNGEPFLPEQLESIAAQTLPPAELVVCDDGSTDNSVAIAEAFAGRAPFAVRVVRNDERLGATKNFERAISLCSGDLIALADQDDVWLSHKLGRLHAVFAADPAVAYAFSNAVLVDEHGRDRGGKPLLDRRFTMNTILRKFAQRRELDLMLKRDFIYGTTLMFHSDLRPLVLPIAATWSHDSWIVNVLAFLGQRGVPLAESLVRYRQHSLQHSGGTGAPRTVGYADRVRAYEDLREHLSRCAMDGGSPTGRELARIDDKLRYLRALVERETAPLPRRTLIAAREVLAGRWWRYSPRTLTVDSRWF